MLDLRMSNDLHLPGEAARAPTRAHTIKDGHKKFGFVRTYKTIATFWTLFLFQ